MNCCNEFFARSSLVIIWVALAAFSGCDKVGSVVDDMKSSVDGSEQPVVHAAPPAEVVQIPTAPVAPVPVPPSPQELVAEFRSLRPDQISDSALARVTSQPEAAAEITEVHIQNSLVSQAGLNSLRAMENLSILSLHGGPWRPEELSLLGQLTPLKSLDISGSLANDQVVGNLTTLESLESLNLNGTPITAAAGVPLSRFSNLHALMLESTAADDSTVAAISKLPIQELDLMRTRISNASILTIKQMNALENLNLAFTAVTGDAFRGFGGAGLKKLNVGETSFGLEGLLAIKGMKSLEDLNVFRAGVVEDKRIASVFKSFSHLRILNAGGNGITNAGMEVFFKGHDSLEELRLSECKVISDQGLSFLVGIKTLTLLEVHGTGCTGNGARALKVKLPNCKITTSDGQY